MSDDYVRNPTLASARVACKRADHYLSEGDLAQSTSWVKIAINRLVGFLDDIDARAIERRRREEIDRGA